MNRASDKLWGDPVWAAAHWGNRRGRPWSDADKITAHQLRAAGKSDADISAELGRTEKSVTSKLGYQRGSA